MFRRAKACSDPRLWGLEEGERPLFIIPFIIQNSFYERVFRFMNAFYESIL